MNQKTTWTWFAIGEHIRLVNGTKSFQYNIEPDGTPAHEIGHWFELSQQEGIWWDYLAKSDWALKPQNHSHRNSLQLEVEHLGAALLGIKLSTKYLRLDVENSKHSFFARPN